MSADPHLLSDGSTSWGPDPGEPSALTAMPVAYGRVLAGSVPEPTEAMVAAVTRRTNISGNPARWLVEEVIAAAPPEWLHLAAVKARDRERALRGGEDQ